MATRTLRAGASFLVIGLASLGMSGIAAAKSSGDGRSTGANAPAGNNGTIKIDEFVMDEGHDNDPHVTCGFSVSFFGYDAGEQHATMRFEGWAPTGGGSATRSTSWTTSPRTGGNQFDTNVTFTAADLAAVTSGATPHPKQGYHVKLTVHVTGARGADVKHKVFWLAPCAATAPASASGSVAPATHAKATATAAPTVTPSVGGATASPAPASAVLGEQVTRTAPVASGAPATRVQAATASRGALPFTGASLALLGLLGAALVAIGSTVVIASRRRSHS
jgi:hypothetical protein